MKGNSSCIDNFSVGLAQQMIKFRFLIVIVMVALTMAIGTGGKLLSFSTDYRVFFSGENPELQAFEKLQNTYTKNDNFFFVLEPKDGKVFTNKTLAAVELLTEKAWLIPFVNRVDSISNYQATYSENDDLIVEDLVYQAEKLTLIQLNDKKNIAISEPLLRNQLITPDAKATAINVTLQYPGQSLYEVPTAAAKAREFKQLIETNYPDIKVSLTGFSMLNNAFAEAGYLDSINLLPMMYGALILFTLIALRSIWGTVATLTVVFLSVSVGMGIGGFSGVLLTPISNSAPIVILTLAIADSVHIFLTLNKEMKAGRSKRKAIIEAVRVNFMPVTITSLTTVVGFLALNFSDAPPYWHLGNMAAVGIVAAWFLSLTLLPALMAILPYRVRINKKLSMFDRKIEALANFVSSKAKVVLFVSVAFTAGLIALIPQLQFEDQWSDYFSKEIQFRNDTDQATKYFGLYPIEYSVPAKEAQGISDPEYLINLALFTDFLRQQPEVAHVFSITDIMKRLNKNMHNDDESYYRLPADYEQSAQFLLLYELSLPYGLDLNDRINIDKSASRITVTLQKTTTAETKVFLNNASNWIKENFPEYMQKAKPTSAQVMFTYITDRNVESMISGTILAVVSIAIIMMFALRSVGLGLLSLIPNCVPILATLGVWSLLVGTVGFSVAAIAAISLGIVVDDTVHFLSKYALARKQKSLNAKDSVVYAFKSVGLAIVINTFILIVGFIVMASSTFKINADLGLLTAITILFALIFDLLMLPALLVIFDKDKTVKTQEDDNTVLTNNISIAGTATMVAAAILGGLSLTTMNSVEAAELSAQEKGYKISAMSDRTDRGFNNSDVSLTMVLRNKAGDEASRKLRIKTLEVKDESVGDQSLVIFEQPKNIKGTALLSHAKIIEADDQWLFLPSLKRVKRISSKNKSGPFVGSEFAFEDFTSLELNKYEHEWQEEVACGDLQCDVIKRTPKYKFSGYSYLLTLIDQTINQVRKVEFYDRRGDKLKELTLLDYKNYGGYWRAQKLTMTNHQTNKETDLLYGDYTFNTKLNVNDFRKNTLTRLK